MQWVNRPETGDQGTMITKKDDKYPTAMIIQKDILFVGFNDGLISVFNTETFRLVITLLKTNAESLKFGSSLKIGNGLLKKL